MVSHDDVCESCGAVGRVLATNWPDGSRWEMCGPCQRQWMYTWRWFCERQPDQADRVRRQANRETLARPDDGQPVTDGGQPVNYRSPEPVETQYTRVFVRGDIAEWNTALYDLRELLRTLETADLNDPQERREAEEALFHGLQEVDLTLRDAWDSRVNREGSQ